MLSLLLSTATLCDVRYIINWACLVILQPKSLSSRLPIGRRGANGQGSIGGGGRRTGNISSGQMRLLWSLGKILGLFGCGGDQERDMMKSAQLPHSSLEGRV